MGGEQLVHASYSERVLDEVLTIKHKHACSLFDATVIYCAEHELDVEDLAEYLDETAKELLRQSALEERMVRKCVMEPPDALQFE